jgi:hypothetical protein
VFVAVGVYVFVGVGDRVAVGVAAGITTPPQAERSNIVQTRKEITLGFGHISDLFLHQLLHPLILRWLDLTSKD